MKSKKKLFHYYYIDELREDMDIRKARKILNNPKKFKKFFDSKDEITKSRIARITLFKNDIKNLF